MVPAQASASQNPNGDEKELEVHSSQGGRDNRARVAMISTLCIWAALIRLNGHNKKESR